MSKLPDQLRKIARRHPSLDPVIRRLADVQIPKAGNPETVEQPYLIPPSDKEGRRPKRK